ncbi:clathrin interactor EPSIN 3 isoform X1 [Nicotiana tabacum]|uniref:Clathrin interactor EPSIN 3 isoform X1 n=5 Tax=Nicotiana TaxID=4085 RepID=A0AC58UTW7_TOBAC|nr:PREDICTED: clathrin interactor EPSIN 3-like [Nicotiana sylvestris]XP_016471747.1 PREDICTED: clathrin interactor EPSIN 3-like isoform X1 [Nicotiana tabacum]
MKKAFGQTVRDIKRGVNKKVLKVPSIEQKVLDATSNEPWGPHGSLLADIAQASRNYHEYQMIMAVIWKRISDTGKNWRHVYKALTILDYLVASGSERVIDEIREHVYQISTLSDFQYIDSSGRDQGSNVRKKSQSLVVLVNDKERIQEVRQKAATNRDKFRNTSVGDMHQPGSYSSSGGYGDRYEEDRYGGRDEERNGYGRDEEKYGRYGDSYSRDGDRYGRGYDERSRDGNKDDDHRGRSRSVDDYSYDSRSRSSDRDKNRAYDDDDGQYSSRGSGARAEDRSQDGSVTDMRLERRFSEQNLDAPPSYEEAIGASRSPTHSERNGETPSASAPKSSSPHSIGSPNQATTPAPAPTAASLPTPAPAAASPEKKDIESFDEFDPRASFSVAGAQSNGAMPTTSGGTEVDLLGSLSEPFSSNSLALVSATTTTSDVNPFGPTSSEPMFGGASPAASVPNQMFEDPFGDGPFKAVPTSETVQIHPQNIAPPSFLPNSNQSAEVFLSVPQSAEVPSTTYAAPNYAQLELSTSNHDIDILADILPPSAPSHSVHPSNDHAIPSGQLAAQTGFPSDSWLAAQPTGHAASLTGFAAQPGLQSPQTSFPIHGQPVSQIGFSAQTSHSPSFGGYSVPPGQTPQTSFGPQNGPASLNGFPSASGSFPHPGIQVTAGHSMQTTANFGGYSTGLGSTGSVGMQMGQTPTGSSFFAQPATASDIPSQMNFQYSQNQTSNLSVPSQSTPVSTALISSNQPAKDKFETKSTVWADTLSRGLVNLNISGPKTNPLADIGVDFDAINRKEKRMEKPSTAPVTSTVTMGKAMGSGSGIGRAGAGALRPSSNPMVGSGMGMGMGMGAGAPGASAGMGVYGVNQPMGMGMGMGMNRPMNMGMGMNLGQGVHMQQPTGFPPGSTMPGGYNPMMGNGNYGQQSFGGGYQ